MIDQTISYPYTLTPTGKVYTTVTPSKIYLDRTLSLLSTNVGQRPIAIDYGVDWSLALFESDGNAQEAIKQAIYQAMTKWLPEISIESITVNYNNSSGLENVLLMLKLPDNTVSSLAINSSLLNYDGTITR